MFVLERTRLRSGILSSNNALRATIGTSQFCLTGGDDLSVMIPDVNGILGDKLTAFAPHTTGIPFGVEKELEVIKQLFDCGELFEAMTDYLEVRESYHRIVKSELGYRGLDVSPEDVLRDTIKGCLCIASRGNPEEDYPYYKDGIYRIRNHILGRKFSGEIAGGYASRVLYLAASILTGQDSIKTSRQARGGNSPGSGVPGGTRAVWP